MNKRKSIVISFIVVFLVAVSVLGNITLGDDHRATHESEKITEIDLTGLQTGGDTNHQHIYEKKHNDSQHWEECFICHNKIGVTNHNLVEKWNLGRKDCYPNEFKITSCADGCGYSKQETLSHISDGVIRHTNNNNHWHYGICTRCSYAIDVIRCRKADGSLITCSNLGECRDCHYVYTTDNSPHQIDTSGNCIMCYKTFFRIENVKDERISNTQVRTSMDIYPANQNFSYYDNWWLYSSQNGTIVNTGNCDYSALPNNGRRLTGTMTFKDGVVGSADFEYVGDGRLNGELVRMEIYMPHGKLHKADIIAPVVRSVNVVGNGNSGNFSQKASVTITASEERDKTLLMALYDQNGKVISDFGAAKDNGNGIFTRVIDIVAETKEPATLTAKIKDTTGNIVSTTCQIQYLDAKAPDLVSYENNKEWSTSKKISFNSKDLGSGKVQIGFNNLNDYSLADIIPNSNNNSYVKTYNFIGDVYGEVTGALYLKDAVGNQTTKKVTISNLDNTAPTITNVKHTLNSMEPNAMLEISANDINTTLNKEGSKIKGYAIVKDTSVIVPNEREFQTSNNFKITDNGKYYVYAIDNVGNISKPKEYTVNNIKWGNIQVDISKNIKLDTTLTNEQLSEYGIIPETLLFNMKVINLSTNKTNNVYVNPNGTVSLSNLDIGKYEIMETPKANFDFAGYEGLYEDDIIKITFNKNKIQIEIKKRILDDKTLSVSSISNIKNVEVMGDVVKKDNYILYN